MTQVIQYTAGSFPFGSQQTAAFVTNVDTGNVGVAASAMGGWTWSQVGKPVNAGGVPIQSGVAAVAFPTISGGLFHFQSTAIYSFAVGDDNRFYVAANEGPFQLVAGSGSAPASIASSPDAVTIAGGSTSSQQICAFAYGGDGNLYAYGSLDAGSAWQWTNMGLPPHGVQPGDTPSQPKAVAISAGNVDVFTVINGQLWEAGLAGSAAELWFAHKSPPGATFVGVLGVVSPTTSPPQPLHGFLPEIFVFLQDGSGNVWVTFWKDVGLPTSPGNIWQWAQLPRPPVTLSQFSIQYGTLCPPLNTRAYVFAVGEDTTVYVASGNLSSLPNSAGDWQWQSLGKYTNPINNSPVFSYPIGTAQNSAGQPIVFLQSQPGLGSDNELYTCTWNGTAGLWASLGTPPG
jgi:hypothetical protein